MFIMMAGITIPFRSRTQPMRRTLILLTALIPALASGCDGSSASSGSRKVTSAEVREKIGETAGGAGRHIAQTKDEFVAELQKLLGKLDGQLTELKAKLKDASEEARPK